MNKFFSKAPLLVFLFALVLIGFPGTAAAQTASCGASGTISSVKSGNWSDPSTWGGRVPGSADTPAVKSGHVVTYDAVSSIVSGLEVACGGTIRFSPSKSGTLQSNKNIIVKGNLEMVPENAAIIHTIRFTGINESAFAGGGENPVVTDIGLWVMEQGKLTLIGAQKTSWTNTAGTVSAGATSISIKSALGWAAGDEIAITPTAKNDFTGYDNKVITSVSGNTIKINSGLSYTHPMVNSKWTAEVMNLTRNVRIEGTPSGKTHLFIRSSQPQTIKYAQIRYVGPRKNVAGDATTEKILGRYGMHFHHSYEGSRGSIVEGNVIRDADNHSYVQHGSNGILVRGNIAYNVAETAFWWDEGFEHASHDIVWDGNIAALVRNYFRSIRLDDVDRVPSHDSRGFLLGHGDGNVAINNVAVGTEGDPRGGGGYKWEAVNNNHLEGVWRFEDNLAHNNGASGLITWQNVQMNHVIRNFNSYHNTIEIFHGAYANSYKYVGGELVGDLVVHAGSSNSSRIRFENMKVTGGNIIIEGSPVPGALPVLFRNVTGNIIDILGQEAHHADVIQSTGTVLNTATNLAETIRVQPISGRPKKITPTGTVAIENFAPTLWGDGQGNEGTGLTGEYYNNPDFTNYAFTRIDSYLGFSEWNAGPHHKITDKTMSVRWTGSIVSQFTESYTFYITSAGNHKLWINDQLVINGSGDGTKGVISLTAGKRYPIKVEFSNPDTNLQPGFNLWWQSPSLSKFSFPANGEPGEYVPQSQLFPASAAIIPPSVNNAPSVNSGTDQVIILPTDSVFLSGSATDADGDAMTYRWSKIAGGSTTIVSANTLTTAITGLIQGTYTFRLTATDSKGASASDDVVVRVDQAPTFSPSGMPTVSITAPVNGSTVSGNVTITGTAADNEQVVAVQFRLDGASDIGYEDGTAPYNAVLNTAYVPDGQHILTAVVRDNDGNRTISAPIAIIIKNTPSSPTTDTKTVVVDVRELNKLNVYTLSGTIIGSVSDATKGTLLETGSMIDGRYRWIKVQFPEIAGWVSSKYLVDIYGNYLQF